MKYVGRVPAPPLDLFIDDIYCLTGVPRYRRMNVPPMPSAHLFVNLGGPVRLWDSDPSVPSAVVTDGWFMGLWTRRFLFEYPTPTRLVGVHFKPWGMSPFAELPATELRDRWVPADAVWQRSLDRIRNQLDGATSAAGALRVLEEELRSRLAAAPSRGLGLVRHTAGRLAASHGTVPVGALSDAAGVSGNHLAAQFTHARIYRFRRLILSVDALRPVDWPELAHAAGYFDQAHFGRARYSGTTWCRWMASSPTGKMVSGHFTTGTIVMGRTMFDLINGWEGQPPTGDHVVVVSHRPKPEGWHPEASYHSARGSPRGHPGRTGASSEVQGTPLDPKDKDTTMPELLIDFITSLDGYAAADGWPGLWGLQGPEYLAWLGEQPEADYTVLMGATTYRLMSGFAAGGEPGTGALTGMSKVVFSTTLSEPLSWANTQLVARDPVEAVREMKDKAPRAMRTIGSLTLGRSLLKAGLVDRFRVVVFPVITGSSGRERIYDGYPDVALDMISSRTFDGRIQLLEYAPTILAGPPGTTSASA